MGCRCPADLFWSLPQFAWFATACVAYVDGPLLQFANHVFSLQKFAVPIPSCNCREGCSNCVHPTGNGVLPFPVRASSRTYRKRISLLESRFLSLGPPMRPWFSTLLLRRIIYASFINGDSHKHRAWGLSLGMPWKGGVPRRGKWRLGFLGCSLKGFFPSGMQY